MTEPIIEGWTNTTEAAAVTGFSPVYVRILARNGNIEARKVGRDWLVNLSSLLAYKRQMERLGTAKHNPWRDDLGDPERGRQRES